MASFPEMLVLVEHMKCCTFGSGRCVNYNVEVYLSYGYHIVVYASQTLKCLNNEWLTSLWIMKVDWTHDCNKHIVRITVCCFLSFGATETYHNFMGRSTKASVSLRCTCYYRSVFATSLEVGHTDKVFKFALLTNLS